MHPRVAKLYLEFMLLAPALSLKGSSLRLTGIGGNLAVDTGCGDVCTLNSTAAYRSMVQKGFTALPHVVPGTPEFARRLARGRWALRQLQETVVVKKYRSMNKRYCWTSQKDFGELVELFGEAKAREMMMGLGNKNVFGYADTVGGSDEHASRKHGNEDG